MARNELVLLDPRAQPVRGMISAQDAASLGPGEWAQLDNLRVEKGLLTCRGGMSAARGTVASGGVFRGVWTGYLWGSYCVVAAVEVSGAVRVLRSTDLSTWTELTAASGKFGNTRLSTSGGVVRFAVCPGGAVPRPTSAASTEALVVVNDYDSPRCIRSEWEEGGGIAAATVSAVTAPTAVQEKAVQVRIVETGMDLQSGVSHASADSDFVTTTQGSAPNRQMRLTISTAVDNGDNATITFGSELMPGPQTFARAILIGVDTAYAALWDKVKVEFGPSGSLKTIWDPSDPISYTRPVGVPVDNTQRMIWAFQYPIQSGNETVDTLKLTWAAATTEAPAADQTADLFLVGFGHAREKMAASSSWAITSCNRGSQTESPGVVYAEYTTQRIKDLGGPVLNELRMPRSDVLNASFHCPIVNPTTTERDAGVSAVNFYVKEPGATEYMLHRQVPIAGWGGSSWDYVYASGTGAGAISWIEAGPDVESGIYYEEEYLPDGFALPIPVCSEVAWANGRLFAGAKTGTAPNLSISQTGNAFRHRQFAAFRDGRPQEDSPIRLSLAGENVRAIMPLAASTAGSSTVFVFTDQSVYALAGQSASQLSQVGRVSNVGTHSPLSVTSDKGAIMFLDTEMQVSKLAGGSLQVLSRQIIDDKLTAIPGTRRQWAGAAVLGDRTYFAYTPEGGSSNSKLLVFDAVAGIFTTDTPPISCDGLVTWFDGTSMRRSLLAFGTEAGSLKVFEYDLASQSQDLGSVDIVCSLDPYELHSPDGGMFHAGRFKAMIDDVDSAVASLVRTYLPSGVNQSTSSRWIHRPSTFIGRIGSRGRR